jgi:hypothetical protein
VKSKTRFSCEFFLEQVRFFNKIDHITDLQCFPQKNQCIKKKSFSAFFENES